MNLKAVFLFLGCSVLLVACDSKTGDETVNQIPIVDAGVDQTVNEFTSVTLTATATDPDGSIASYSWNQAVGSNVTLINAGQVVANFIAPDVPTSETLTFVLTVTDDVGDTVTDSLNVLVIPTHALNDTGITLCGDYAYGASSVIHNNDVDCALTIENTNGNNPVPAGQDGHYGRDADPGINSNLDGHAGFSFTKLAADGGGDLISTAQSWGCVRDEVTGLVWEVKTDDAGLQGKTHTYTWYNSTGTNDGGLAGYGDTGPGTTTVVGQPGSDNCANDASCDTEKYVTDINSMAQPLCGYTDWRLPTIEELSSIADLSFTSPAIDILYFPYTQIASYWSSTPNAESNNLAWLLYFGNANDNNNSKNYTFWVRLVRGQ